MKGKCLFAERNDMKAVQGFSALSLQHEYVGGAPAVVCAGGNREAVEPRGTAAVGAIVTLKDAVEQKLEWDNPIAYLDETSFSWLSDGDFKMILQSLLFDMTDVTDGLEEYLYGNDIDFVKVRSYFANDYLRCRSLFAELEYRLNKL